MPVGDFSLETVLQAEERGGRPHLARLIRRRVNAAHPPTIFSTSGPRVRSLLDAWRLGDCPARFPAVTRSDLVPVGGKSPALSDDVFAVLDAGEGGPEHFIEAALTRAGLPATGDLVSHLRNTGCLASGPSLTGLVYGARLIAQSTRSRSVAPNAVVSALLVGATEPLWRALDAGDCDMQEIERRCGAVRAWLFEEEVAALRSVLYFPPPLTGGHRIEDVRLVEGPACIRWPAADELLPPITAQWLAEHMEWQAGAAAEMEDCRPTSGTAPNLGVRDMVARMREPSWTGLINLVREALGRTPIARPPVRSNPSPFLVAPDADGSGEGVAAKSRPEPPSFTELAERLHRRLQLPMPFVDELAETLHLHLRGASMRQCVLLAGSSGAGKTYCARVLAEVSDCAFYRISATDLTETGFQGLNLTEVGAGIFAAGGGDQERGETAIVVIDEADKIRIGSAVGVTAEARRAVQANLLALVGGGTPLTFSQASGRQMQLSTDRMLILATGAFSDLSEEPTRDNLVEYGLLPELVGRLDQILVLPERSPAQIARLLADGEDSPIRRFRRIFGTDGYALSVPEATLHYLAERTAEDRSRFGMRAAVGALNKALRRLHVHALRSGAPKGTRFTLPPDAVERHA